MDLERLKTFYVLAKAGSFTKAAHVLNISQPAVSRSLDLFEGRLKSKLINRSKRGLTLTPEGERVFEFAHKFLSEAENVTQSLKEKQEAPSGKLKILTTPGMASIWLPEFIPGFLERYPEISLDIYNELTGLEKNIEEVDLLIRTSITHHLHLTQRHVMSANYKLYASPEYLNKFGTPQSVEELDNHRLLVFENSNFNVLGNNYWILEAGSKTDKPGEPFLIINSLEGLISCAKKGLGIIGLPEELVSLRIENNNLINILKDEDGPTVEIFCIYQKKKEHFNKIKVFVDYLEEMKKQGYAEPIPHKLRHHIKTKT